MLAAAGRVLLWKPLPVAGAAPADGFTRVAGILHVHTRVSDGAGTPEEVIAAAQRAGLAFLVITDHNALDAKTLEGRHGDVLVLVGAELSTVAGHLLALGIPEPPFVFSRDPIDDLADVRDLGGVAFVAHPSNPRPDLAWSAWDAPGPWGIEVLNGDSQFRQAGLAARARTVTAYPLNARYALLSHMSRPAATLQRWDALLARRPAAGIAGADAHGQVELAEAIAVKAPSYESLFAIARSHVLLEQPFTGRVDADRAALLSALAGGRSYVGVDALAPADGFFFVAESGGRAWTMGDTAPLSPPPRLRAGGRMPEGTRLVLLRDGRPVTEVTGGLDVPAPGPGIYRVEAYVGRWPVPWIISNPIAVLDEAAAEARARAAEWPPPVPAPSPAALLADFDHDRGFFEPAADSWSSVQPTVWDAQGGVSGGAARLAFRLGVPDQEHPHTYCALVNHAARDLMGAQGLVFSVRADGVYRLWVQVRDANPASPDGGTEWWFASVRTSPQWQRVAVPFSRLRSIQKGSDGRLDPDKVRALVFIIDRGAMKPGSSGTIWIDDLGVY